MKRIKVWFLTKMILLCDLCLSFKEGAEDQRDINEVIAAKNKFIKDMAAIKQKCNKW